MASATSAADNIYPYPSMLNIANFVSIKLSDSNYRLWKAQMLCLLGSQELVGFIDGTIQPPSETSPINGRGGGAVAHQDYLKWIRTDLLVKGWFLGSLSEEMLQNVAEKVSARDVWLELEEICRPKSPTKLKAEGITVQPTFEKEDIMESEKDYKYYLPLYEASVRGAWYKATVFLENDKEASRAPINSLLQTALHVAIGAKKRKSKFFVEKLVASMADDALVVRDCLGETPLHYAARYGNLDAAQILVNRNADLPHIESQDGLYPIHLAAEYKSVGVFRYFFSVTKNSAPYTGDVGAGLLSRLIGSGLYDLATELIQNFPDLAKYRAKEFSPLALLATQVTLFCDVSPSTWQRKLIAVRSTRTLSEARANVNDIEIAVNQPQLHKPKPCIPVSTVLFDILSQNLRSTIDDLTGRVLERQNAIKLAECLCEKLKSLSEDEIKSIIGGPLLLAARYDNYKLVEIVGERFPSSLHYCNENGKNILHIAIENRCEDVFKLVCKMSEHRNQLYHLVTSVDSSNNTMLHLAGKLAPQNKLQRTYGAAIQMQQELQWFEEVRKRVPPSYYGLLNNDGKEANQIFVEEHANLRKEGEKWLKETANACTIVSALIAAIAFAAAITVPGGNDSNSGLPTFLRNRAFIVFFVSNAISLFASCNSLAGFLSIWTSRYAEEDFQTILPQLLMAGLVDMLTSIMCMIISFCSTLYIVSGQKRWVFSLVGVLTLPRLGLYMNSAFPLLPAVKLTLRGMGATIKDKSRT